jgi:hypothetical protein
VAKNRPGRIRDDIDIAFGGRIAHMVMRNRWIVSNAKPFRNMGKFPICYQRFQWRELQQG